MRGWCCFRSYSSRAERYWQDRYACIKTLQLVYSHIYMYEAKTTEIDVIRFQDKDLSEVGILEHGQFGVVCVINIYLHLHRGLPSTLI